MSVAETIKSKLTDALAPSELQVIDESHKHKGHRGARPEGETHFHVVIVAERFAGMMRVARQRLVYGILADELAGPVHALSLETVAPGEGKRAG
ncbi:BolA family protein [Iodidimonas sp. SYSU 1G8]|uniref:BolA family protein n=1 Tax=Iodidimonas sp. SYSU 1G8 TaxID=3133967 RepID=UPI0031FF1979